MKSTTVKARAVFGVPAAIIALALALPASANEHGKGGEYFKKADTNSDGFLTKQELQAHKAQRFIGADTDKDGFISADELTAHHADRMKARQERHSAKFTERFDANKDGKVAVEEIQNAEPHFFTQADANADGKLSQDEMSAAKSKMHHSGEKGMMHQGPATE